MSDGKVMWWDGQAWRFGHGTTVEWIETTTTTSAPLMLPEGFGGVVAESAAEEEPPTEEEIAEAIASIRRALDTRSDR